MSFPSSPMIFTCSLEMQAIDLLDISKPNSFFKTNSNLSFNIMKHFLTSSWLRTLNRRSSLSTLNRGTWKNPCTCWKEQGSDPGVVVCLLHWGHLIRLFQIFMWVAVADCLRPSIVKTLYSFVKRYIKIVNLLLLSLQNKSPYEKM